MSWHEAPLTDWLARWRGGDRGAADRVLSATYHPLRRLAQRTFGGERRDHTLQPTALVHEVYLAMAARDPAQDRRHFFAMAASMMRSLLVDHGRRRQCRKRGGDRRRVPLEGLEQAQAAKPLAEYVALDQALEALARLDPRKAAIVEQRYYLGRTVSEIARNMGIAERTVGREWRRARLWLFTALDPACRDAV